MAAKKAFNVVQPCLRADAEVVAFALGGFSSMPAVRNFSICAALAVFLDFCLQVPSLPFEASSVHKPRIQGMLHCHTLKDEEKYSTIACM